MEKLTDFETALTDAQRELGIDFSDYYWVLETDENIPWDETKATLESHYVGEEVSVTLDYYFQTVQIRFGSRIVARSFHAFTGWLLEVVTWINPEDLDEGGKPE